MTVEELFTSLVGICLVIIIVKLLILADKKHPGIDERIAGENVEFFKDRYKILQRDACSTDPTLTAEEIIAFHSGGKARISTYMQELSDGAKIIPTGISIEGVRINVDYKNFLLLTKYLNELKEEEDDKKLKANQEKILMVAKKMIEEREQG